MNTAHEISLKDLIRAVSDELIASRQERLAGGRPAVFEVAELTIEASFVLTDSSGGSGGFDLKILKADARADYKQERVHKITVKLNALQDRSVLRELGDELPLRPRSDDR
jgi:hypothetical protein